MFFFFSVLYKTLINDYTMRNNITKALRDKKQRKSSKYMIIMHSLQMSLLKTCLSLKYK